MPGKLGSPETTICEAVKAIEAHDIIVTKKSRIWLTSPVPVSNQPLYRNAVIEVTTDLEAEDLLSVLQSIENEFGRTRKCRNDPRVLDLDLLDYQAMNVDTQNLVLPHPRMHERGFVLLPLQEIAADWRHPVLKTPLSMLISQLPEDQVASPLEV